MNRRILPVALLFAALASLAAPSACAAEDEDALLAILASDKPVGEKAWACRSLKQKGTARAVPVLAACLTDKDLSHSARYALETMLFPEAGAALRDALGKTTGLAQAGIADSLGARRDREAVAALARLAMGEDAAVASSAATALGRIGGKEAAEALRAAQSKAPAAARPAVADGLLLCADQFLAAADKAGAAGIYKDLYGSKAPEHVRTAAFRGLVLAADDCTAPLGQALAGDDRAARRAALQLVREIPGDAVTRVAADLLAKADPATQVALIAAIEQRGDRAAVPAVVTAAKAPAPEVRLAALAALGPLGDASAVPPLIEIAAGAAGPERDAARAALARIPGEAADKAVLARLEGAPAAMQMEIARVMAARQMRWAVPTLLDMAKAENEATRMAAASALGELAGCQAAPPLVKLLLAARSDAELRAFEKALAAACCRTTQPEMVAKVPLAAMKGATPPQRAALLRVAGQTGGAEALQAMRDGLKDADALIQEAALRTLSDFGPPEAAPDLLALAKDAPSLPQRVIALRGYWRLVGLAAGRPVEERLAMCQAGMAAAQRPEERKLGLNELAKVPHADALKLAEGLCADEAVRGEAEAACVQIAASLVATSPNDARAALQRVMTATKDENLRGQASKALDAIDQNVGYVTPWLAAGPYREQGKECSALFDVAFPPEQASGGDVAWKPAPAPADAALAWQVDLGGLTGGDHCVLYIKTRVYSPAEEAVRLDIGTDDGIKLWINGKLVHANNAIRALTPGSDKAQATLRKGWNDLVAKITQHTAGCGACIRIRKADGSILDGLRVDPAGK